MVGDAALAEAIGAAVEAAEERRAVSGPRRPEWDDATDTLVTVLRTVWDLAGELPWPRVRELLDDPALTPEWITDGVDVREAELGGRRCRWITTPDPAAGDGVYLFLYGGGYVTGRPEHNHNYLCHVARRTGLRTACPDYGLAPEHPFPAAVDDAVRTYAALLDEGTDPAQVLLGGASAGGGLAVAMLLALRDAGLPLPAGAAVVSPTVDLSLSSQSLQGSDEADFVTLPLLARMFGTYLAGGADPADPLASPLLGDPTGLPPLLVHVGGAEIVADDGRRLAAWATEGDVDAHLAEHAGMFHVFAVFPDTVPQALVALDELAAFATRCGVCPA